MEDYQANIKRIDPEEHRKVPLAGPPPNFLLFLPGRAKSAGFGRGARQDQGGAQKGAFGFPPSGHGLFPHFPLLSQALERAQKLEEELAAARQEQETQKQEFEKMNKEQEDRLAKVSIWRTAKVGYSSDRDLTQCYFSYSLP